MSKNIHAGHRNRLKEEIVSAEISADKSPVKLLEMLLFYGTPQKDTSPMAHELIESVLAAAKIEDYEVVAQYTGKELELIRCKHPFIDRESLVIVGDHVTLDAGTGCVHTAPGHGAEDYVACRNYPDRRGRCSRDPSHGKKG